MSLESDLESHAEMIRVLASLNSAEAGGHTDPEKAIADAFMHARGQRRQTIFTTLKAGLQDDIKESAASLHKRLKPA